MVLNANQEKVHSLCRKFELSPIERGDYEILQKYMKIMDPISIYLDLLQGVINCYLGMVLPSLAKIKFISENLSLKKGAGLRDELLLKIDHHKVILLNSFLQEY